MLRIDDLDGARCKPQYLAQQLQDLTWFGIAWDNDAADGAYHQSRRKHYYEAAWRCLFEQGHLYPSPHSRKDVERCLSAPHAGEGEVVFPTELRPYYVQDQSCVGLGSRAHLPADLCQAVAPGKVNWRFRVPDGRAVTFTDTNCGPQRFIAGTDFGDFLVWRADDMASYELAVVVDDLDMGVTEVVRGEDLLLSTARQLLLMEVLLLQRDVRDGGGDNSSTSKKVPTYFHCPLVMDKDGMRMAKRCASTTLQSLREESGLMPSNIKEMYSLPM